MFNSKKRILFTAGILLVLLGHGSTASAQCSSFTPQFGNVSLQRGNPFQGEYSTTMTPAPLSGMTLPPPPALHSVARDSEGRVREERAAGKFKVKTADGAESEQEQHLITICDPVSQKLIRLDTLNKTATVMGSRIVLPRPGFAMQRASQPFCSTYLKMYRSSPRFRSEDLGTQMISGVEAEGVRTWMVVDSAAGSAGQSPSSYQDRWCSEGLGAFVMQAYVTSRAGNRNETVLKNIERREPDAALFQIPADYTIEERAADGNVRSGWRSVSPNSTSTLPQ
jgi:hypothetical protein